MKRYKLVSISILPMLIVLLSSCAQTPSLEETEVVRPTAAASHTPPVSTPTSVHVPPGRIAYIGEDGNIYTYSPLEGSSTSETSDASRTGKNLIVYTEPTWRPRTGDISFVRSEFSTDQSERFAIQLRTPLQDETRTIYKAAHPPFYLFWSPAGSFLSFLASTDTSTLSFRVLDPGGQLIVEDKGQPYYWDWAGDDGGILAHVGGAIEINPEGARLSVSKNGLEGFEDIGHMPLRFQAPAYSPDGNHVLTPALSLEGTRGLFILDDVGEIVSRVMPADEFMTFDWSPTGESIAVNSGPMFADVHLGELSLFTVEDRINPALQAVVDEGVAAFWWSPKGDRLAYFKPLILPTISTQPISNDAQTEDELYIQMYVYDLGSRQSEELVSVRPTIEFLRILRFYDQYQRSATIWSPDGSHIVYSAVLEDGKPGVYIMPAAAGGISQFVGEGMHAFWSWE